MNAVERRAPLEDRLAHLAATVYERAWSDGDTVSALGEFLRDTAASLSEFSTQLREEYLHLTAAEEEGVPTLYQGLALARFLRRNRHAHGPTWKVGIGLYGLGAEYLHITCFDGYEAGIAPDGSVST